MIIEINENDLNWIIYTLYGQLARLEREQANDPNFYDKYLKEIKTLIIKMNTIKEYYEQQ